MSYTTYSEIAHAMSSYSAIKEAVTGSKHNVTPINPSGCLSSSRRITKTVDLSIDSLGDVTLALKDDGKFLTFLTQIKQKGNTTALMYVEDGRIVVIVRPNKNIPYLIMRIPATSANSKIRCESDVCFTIPLEKINLPKSVGSDHSYIFAYVREAGLKSYKLVFQTPTSKQKIESQGLMPINYVNNALRLMSTSDISDTSTFMTNDEIDIQRANLNNITISMLERVDSTGNFTEFDTLSPTTSIIFNVTPDVLVREEICSDSTTEKLTASKETATIWQFTKPESYRVYDRSVLMKATYTSAILSNDHKYRAFGVFGSYSVYMKIIADRPVIISGSGPLHSMKDLFPMNTHLVFIMYLCEKQV